MVPLLAVLALPWISHAQAKPEQKPKGLIHRTPEEAAETHRQERRIVLDAIVTDASGKPVTGLQQQSFTVLDNHQPQELVSFREVKNGASGDPVEIIFLVDLINTTYHQVAFVRQGIERFLKQNGGHLPYPASIILLSDTNIQAQPQPSSDGNALVAALENAHTGLRAIGRSTGAEGAIERLQMSLNGLSKVTAYEATKPGRKLLLWISPGWPMLSAPGFSSTSEEQRTLFDSIVLFTNGLRRARMTLYSLNPLSAGEDEMRLYYYQNFLKPVTAERQAQPGNLAVQVLAVQSGGLALPSSNDITSEINTCVAAGAGANYILSFDPAPTEITDQYHALSVRVSQPGARVRTNAGYYSEP